MSEAKLVKLRDEVQARQTAVDYAKERLQQAEDALGKAKDAFIDASLEAPVSVSAGFAA